MTKRKTTSVGLLIFAKNTKRHLFLLRNDVNPKWALPGGKLEHQETLREAIVRECEEEIQFNVEPLKLFPLEQFVSDDKKFVYHTFYTQVDEEFTPVLNGEHIGYCWVDKKIYPKPLHSGLFTTLGYELTQQKIQIIHDSLN